jgi:CDP-diacylglycerol--glycerol-3-phosphate 3-phosphatidyltransferase
MNAVKLSLYELKPRFQALLRPAVGAMAARGVTANQVTVLAAAGSVALGAALMVWGGATRWLFLLLPVWFLLRMALNAADGMLAREFGQKSRLGAYLNELSDVVADAALYLPFALVMPWGIPGVAAMIFLATVTEFAGVLGTMIGGERRYDGPMGKSDRALVFAALSTWIGLGFALPSWSGWLWPVLALLLALNIVNRVRAGLASAKS